MIDTKQRTTLHRTAMQPALAGTSAGHWNQMGHAALALQDTGEAGVDYLISEGIELNHATHQWLKVTRATVHKRKDLATAAHEHTVRVGIVAGPEQAKDVQRRSERRVRRADRAATRSTCRPTAWTCWRCSIRR